MVSSIIRAPSHTASFASLRKEWPQAASIDREFLKNKLCPISRLSQSCAVSRATLISVETDSANPASPRLQMRLGVLALGTQVPVALKPYLEHPQRIFDNQYIWSSRPYLGEETGSNGSAFQRK
jgi:hypothetical protein